MFDVSNVTIEYQTPDGTVSAVSDASMELTGGEYFGLVGESGCGKSTLAKAILQGLDPNGKVTTGRITYKGEDLTKLSEDEMNERIRWKEIAWIPQSSMNSLDPLLRISDHAVEVANTHTEWTEQEALDVFGDFLEIVGLSKDRIDDYPHQFSGGMQQRVIIALSLFLEPDILIADEPTTALDVIMQDQIFRYIQKAQDELDMALILITHDIALVFQNCDRLAVMHAGQIAEKATVEDFFDAPHHPYSILLQESLPDVSDRGKKLQSIEGEPPMLHGDIAYCTFRDRCPWEVEECSQAAPKPEPVEGEWGNSVACFRKNEVRSLVEEQNGDSRRDQSIRGGASDGTS